MDGDHEPSRSRKLVIVGLLSSLFAVLFLSNVNDNSRSSPSLRRDGILSKFLVKNLTSEEEEPASASDFVQVHANEGKLDFAIIGFPKTGTTTLLKTLLKHNETTLYDGEFCDFFKHNTDKKLMRHVQSLREAANHSVKVGIKCPKMARETIGTQNIANLFNDTRLVVGVRHPVLWFQSFYNYRVRNHYHLNLTEPNGIPSPLSLSTREWRSVSTEDARFHLFLMQLAKVPLETVDIKQLASMKIRRSRITPNPFKIFIFATEQLGDSNITRHGQFKEDFQNYLQLKTPINQFEHSNTAGNESFPEMINICDEEYEELRTYLVKYGRLSSHWIRRKFIQSDDVVVSNEEHFISLLKDWQNDPCVEQNEMTH